MKTFFASAERLDGSLLEKEVGFVNDNPILTGLLHSVSGLLAVLNRQRQILALNESLLTALGVGDAHGVMGLRLGEAIHCVHSSEMPGGCGTSEHCSSCGAVIAMVSSLESNRPVERTCAVTVNSHAKKRDLYFRVRSVPVSYDDSRLLLLFIQDITYEQNLAVLERIFHHDLNGILHGLLMSSGLLSAKAGPDTRDLAGMVHKFASRLSTLVKMQQLLQKDVHDYHPTVGSFSVSQVMEELREIQASHPASKGKLLTLNAENPDLMVGTDFFLLVRILNNMVTNAMEASDAGDEVRVAISSLGGKILFSVWNRHCIPPEVAMRIFQRNFSTKPERGRGLGTYSMKLFGEEILGGSVDFQTSEAEGTVFRLALPMT